MLANANTQTSESQFTRQVREVMSICAQNDVPIGKPDNLADFLRALESNKHLAMNFWSMVARSEKDHAGDSDWLLNAIVEGVTGRTIAELDETGPNATLMVVKLSSVLAGEDVPLTPFPPAPARDLEDPAEAGRWARASVPPQVTPIASRQQPPESSRPLRSEAAAVPIERITNPAWLNDGSLRLVLKPEPETAALPPAQTPVDDVPITIPLSAYADDNPQRTISPFWLSATLATLLFVFGVWFVLHRNPGALTNLSASLRAKFSSFSAPNHQPTTAGEATNPLAENSSASAPPSPTSSANSTPVPLPAHSAAPTAAPIHSSTDQPAARSRFTDREATDSASPSDTNGRVVVPETLMRQNLISSRVPIYPDSARGIDGLVVMHAIITARGTVEDLRVIEGDPALRQAAIDAASAWRFRPYTVSGTPVDVSTTLTVDFSSKRTPSAATPIPMQ